jgi:hypothetical protein
MQTRFLFKLAFLAFIALLANGCFCLPNAIFSNPNSQTTATCPALPADFNEADLIGTWKASYSLNDQDILIIKEDGTYKQIYDVPDAGFRYESDWLEWWIEYRESGYIRLHLEGMRRCDGIQSIFERAGGGIDQEMIWAIDMCENEVVEMPDKTVLIVTGSKDDVPRGITLKHARMAGSDWYWSFEFVDE